jgi:hypothetical protein
MAVQFHETVAGRNRIAKEGSAGMKVARKNEQPKMWFRSERVFLEGSRDWYFQTREGVAVGPYESQAEAEIEASLLKELLRELHSEETVTQTIREFVSESFSMGRPLSPRFSQDERSTS